MGAADEGERCRRATTTATATAITREGKKEEEEEERRRRRSRKERKGIRVYYPHFQGKGCAGCKKNADWYVPTDPWGDSFMMYYCDSCFSSFHIDAKEGRGRRDRRDERIEEEEEEEEEEEKDVEFQAQKMIAAIPNKERLEWFPYDET